MPGRSLANRRARPDNSGIVNAIVMADLLVTLLAVYLAAGLGFAPWFAWRGAGRLDPVAREGSMGFRLLVLPAATMLWPWLLARLARGGPAPPEEVNAHRVAARAAARGAGGP